MQFVAQNRVIVEAPIQNGKVLLRLCGKDSVSGRRVAKLNPVQAKKFARFLNNFADRELKCVKGQVPPREQGGL